MTDAELTRAVAEKAGWKRSPEKSTYDRIQSWIGPDGGRYFRLPPWPTSIDVAMKVMKPSNKFDLWQDDTGWNCSDHGGFSHGQKTECHAILKAFLKVKP